jgi:uncharacterized protein YbjT (DUF2867 family)
MIPSSIIRKPCSLPRYLRASSNSSGKREDRTTNAGVKVLTSGVNTNRSIQQPIKFSANLAMPAFEPIVTPTNDIVVVIGATGNLGFHTVEAALKAGNSVIGTSRSANPAGFPTGNPQLQMMQMLNTDSPEAWARFFSRLPEGANVLVVCAIGGAHPKPGQTLRDLNVTPAVAAVKGLAKVQNHFSNVSFVNYSSIAATMPHAGEYAKVKSESDEAIMDVGAPNTKILRVPMVMESQVENKIKCDVSWTYPQMAFLPRQPVVGDREDKIPLQYIAMDDLVEGAVNAQKISGSAIIPAVTSDIQTQAGMHRHFTTLFERPLRLFHIPAELMIEFFATHPNGHCAPYAAEYCKHGGTTADPQEFETLLGRRPKQLPEIYQVKDGMMLAVAEPPPVMAYMFEIWQNVKDNESARSKTLKMGMDIPKILLWQRIKT